MKKPDLRVATDADAEKAKQDAETKPAKSLAEAIEGGTYLEILIAQRREMIRDVALVTGPAKAALHRQIALSSKEIAQLQVAAAEEAAEDAEAEDEPFDAEAL